MFPNTQLFLVMDHEELPSHIRQTFRLYPTGTGWESDLTGLTVAVVGQQIDLKASGYVLVYAQNEWHGQLLYEIREQLKALRQDAQILLLPVEIEPDRPALPPTGGGPFRLPGMP